ncbi:MAG: sugar phosphate isomerase/epimerase [Armatimonadetes bacterium]|nr:sugar phosphate isomerase/epimerase [Armatimonadota bacterium]
MRYALHTVSYAGLWGQAYLSLEDTIRKAGKLGYQGVFVMAKRPHASLLDLTEARCEAVRRVCDECSVEVMGLAAYTDFTGGLRAGEVPFGEYQVHAVGELCRLTAVLGGKLLRVFTGYEAPEASFAAQWQKVTACLREAAELAAWHGVTLGVQNHHDLAVGTEAYAALLRAVDHPACRAMYDAWSPALRGEDLYQGALRMAPLTVNTTVADYIRLPRWRYRPELVNYVPEQPDEVRAVPLGDGFVDYASFVRGLIDGGFDGWMTYEMCSPLRGGGSEANLDRCAAKALETMRGWG